MAVAKNASRCSAAGPRIPRPAPRHSATISARPSDKLHVQHQPPRKERPLREHQDERQQVQRQRDHPEERHRRDVRAQVRGRPDQQARRRKRQQHPPQPPVAIGNDGRLRDRRVATLQEAPDHRRVFLDEEPHRSAKRTASLQVNARPQSSHQRHLCDAARGSRSGTSCRVVDTTVRHEATVRQREHRARPDQHQQRVVEPPATSPLAPRSASSARSRTDTPGGPRSCRGCSPRRGNTGCVPTRGACPRTSAASSARRPRAGKTAGLARRSAVPAAIRSAARSPADAPMTRAHESAAGRSADASSARCRIACAARRQEPRGDVRVQVPGQQQRLEEQQAGVPDRRTPAQERQHHLREQRLDRKQQRRVEEDRGREQAHQQRRRACHVRDGSGALDGATGATLRSVECSADMGWEAGACHDIVHSRQSRSAGSSAAPLQLSAPSPRRQFQSSMPAVQQSATLPSVHPQPVRSVSWESRHHSSRVSVCHRPEPAHRRLGALLHDRRPAWRSSPGGPMSSRRDFLKQGSAVAGAIALGGTLRQRRKRTGFPAIAPARRHHGCVHQGAPAWNRSTRRRWPARTFADARIGRYLQNFVVTREQQIINVVDTDSIGIGVRALVNGTWGFAASRDLTKDGVAAAAREAVAIAKANRSREGSLRAARAGAVVSAKSRGRARTRSIR